MNFGTAEAAAYLDDLRKEAGGILSRPDGGLGASGMSDPNRQTWKRVDKKEFKMQEYDANKRLNEIISYREVGLRPMRCAAISVGFPVK
jgi:hypothetical protein